MEEVRVIKPIKKVGGTVVFPPAQKHSNRALLFSGTVQRNNAFKESAGCGRHRHDDQRAQRIGGVKLEQHGDEVIVQGCEGNFSC